MMDTTRFLHACQFVMDSGKNQRGIGTLGEKTLHAVLKLYFEPDEAKHEISVGRYVTDIYNENGFIEIQTRQFYRLREKLSTFLEQAPVTVVYPVPALKWLSWIDENGEVSPKRKSPKQARACEILPELYKIKAFLGHKNLHFCIVILEVEEYRLKNGWGNDGKRGSTRFDRLPVTLLDEIWLNEPNDYGQLIPEILNENFTVKEFAKAAKLSPSKANSAVNVLLSVGALKRVGKIKNAFVYSRSTDNKT